MESLILKGNKSDFTVCQNSIKLDPTKNYEAGLSSLVTCNSIPNINEGKNNIFSYSTDNGETWKNIALLTESYELIAINNEIQRHMISNGDSGDAIDIEENISRLTSIVNIKNPTYKVNFGVSNSIGSVLGFGAKQIGPGYNESPNIVKIMQVNTILVNLDIIMGCCVNGLPSPTIYSFYPNVSPGYTIVVERPKQKYYPISRYDINRIRVWLTDQHGNLIDLREEEITIYIDIREAVPRNINQEILKELREINNCIKNK